ncbi:transposase zinc-binding domain-containing protein [Methylomicrobium sp. Wu6]|uniref:transposase zinc-binding domain-containing protein n=1 Tax=Methylomicrobium sp. Wu6 TaxID=3107928 RepID=UPI002DD65987|nr:transposase zinc-binding domain-containing protein [Methylomicrobium sp. Wu6]MEC4747054.1 transposase zinc-binding domain-containing protein [Methylomicrobium sp. Wu6]
MFRAHRPAWRQTQQTHLSLGQLKAMSAAIEQCRTATLGGYVLCCPACAYQDIVYSSCRIRHYLKARPAGAKSWLEARQADLLPVEY